MIKNKKIKFVNIEIDKKKKINLDRPKYVSKERNKRKIY